MTADPSPLADVYRKVAAEHAPAIEVARRHIADPDQWATAPERALVAIDEAMRQELTDDL